MSGEVLKYGVELGDCVMLVKYIVSECLWLKFVGLMMIGMLDYTSKSENFETLRKCREEVCAAFGMSESECELSMGMSGDFEVVIVMGSMNVCVGSMIFGVWDYFKK